MEVKTHCSKEELIENLKDAGCSEAIIKEFMMDIEEGKLTDSMKLLAKHRDMLLNIVHAEEKKIDCLDYLVYMLQKKNTAMGRSV